MNVQNNVLVHFVTAGGLTKLLMQTSTTKTKSCSIRNDGFHCLLWRVFFFKVSRNLKSKASNLVLDLFTWSIIFYDVGFLWCMFLVAWKKF